MNQKTVKLLKRFNKPQTRKVKRLLFNRWINLNPTQRGITSKQMKKKLKFKQEKGISDVY